MAFSFILGNCKSIHLLARGRLANSTALKCSSEAGKVASFALYCETWMQ